MHVLSVDELHFCYPHTLTETKQMNSVVLARAYSNYMLVYNYCTYRYEGVKVLIVVEYVRH